MPGAQVRHEIHEGHRLGRVVPQAHGTVSIEHAEAGSRLIGGAGGLGQELEGPDRHGARARPRDLGPDCLAQGEAAGTVEGRTRRLRRLFPHHHRRRHTPDPGITARGVKEARPCLPTKPARGASRNARAPGPIP